MQVLMMLPEVYFLSVIVIAIFLIGWGIGVVFFFAVKRKHSMQELNVFRLYFAVELLFVPAIIEFSILRQKIQVPLLLLSAAIALAVTISIRSYGRFLSVSCFYDKPFIKKHFFEIVMIAFVAYFWLFSFLTGYYKPQFKKEYEMINYNDGWYYVLARYDNCLVLSTSFNAGSKKVCHLSISTR
ncbi:putative inner membrane protein [Escherichia coli DEC9B]|nr:putative inner membrane protein [Escherichia coli DEC9B]